MRGLIERGKQFEALAGMRYKAYVGMAEDRTPPFPTSRYVRNKRICWGRY